MIFWLGIISPLVLVCLVFAVVAVAGRKQDELSPPSPPELDPSTGTDTN